MNLGFPIQNLPSDSRLQVRFRHFEYFRVAFSDKLHSGADACSNTGRKTTTWVNPVESIRVDSKLRPKRKVAVLPIANGRADS